MSNLDKRWLVALLWLLTVFCLFLFFIPAFVIRPFRYQSARALDLAIRVKQLAPALSLIALVILLAVTISLWRKSSIPGRTGIVIALLLSIASTVMIRQNYFEWMFHPITAAGFVSPSAARLADNEMVMTVQIGSETRAYPILQMAYHHILNDTVSGQPIVVTY